MPETGAWLSPFLPLRPIAEAALEVKHFLDGPMKQNAHPIFNRFGLLVEIYTGHSYDAGNRRAHLVIGIQDNYINYRYI